MALEIQDIDFEYEQDENEAPIVNVGDNHQAEAHLRALDYWRYEVEQIEAHAKKEIERIQMWRDEEVAKLQKKIAWHEGGLIAFLQVQGKKTLKLINGTIKRIKGRDRVDVLDAETLGKWSEANNANLMRVKVEPDKKAILDHIKSTGELPEGVDVVTGADSFKIETKG